MKFAVLRQGRKVIDLRNLYVNVQFFRNKDVYKNSKTFSFNIRPDAVVVQVGVASYRGQGSIRTSGVSRRC